MTRSRKWVIFKADDEHGWEDRMFAHTHSLTDILCEHFDSTGSEVPEPGYRPLQKVRIDADHDPNKHGWCTHYKKKGDWRVDRVEEYTPDMPVGTEYTIVVVCWCVYDPIESDLTPVPDRIISADSFGGDETKYQEYLNSQKVPTGV